MTIKLPLHRRAVSQIMEDIELLSPAEFELVAHDLICCFENQKLIHRGLTARVHPVGYSLDSFDSTGKIIGEYGTEANYFEGDLSKIREDIEHARSIEPDHARLYLLSNQMCKQSTWRKVTALIREYYPSPASSAVKVAVLDVREMADRLCSELITKSDLIDGFIPLLPSLLELKQGLAFEKALPIRPIDCVRRPSIQSAIHDLIADNRMVAIIGLSGSGKTYSAKEYCHDTKDGWDQIIWAEGDDVRHGALEGVTIQRLGMTVNLLGRLTQSRTLLVIDRWTGPSEDLANIRGSLSGAHPGTRILITSENDLAFAKIPTVSAHTVTRDEARAILSWETPVAPPEEVISRVVATAAGFPLVLAIIRENVSALDSTWDDVLTTLNDISSLERDNRTIVERVLQPSIDALNRELSALSFLGLRTIDRPMLTHLIGPIGVNKLRRRCLLTDGTSGVLHVHDLILSVIQTCIKSESTSLFQDAFWDYFVQHVRQRPPHYIRAIHRCAGHLRARAEDDLQPNCIARAYLDLEEAADSQIVQIFATLNLEAYSSTWCEASCIVESMELLWRYGDEDYVSRKQIASENARKLESIGTISTIPEDVREYILYHAAKFILFSEDPARALDLLGRCSQDSWGTQLQRIRCLRDLDRKQEARSELELMLDRVRDSKEHVPPSIALAAFCDLRHETFADLQQKYLLADTRLFFEIVEAAIAEGNGQPYDAIVLLANTMGYEHPEFLTTLIQHVEPPEPTPTNRRMNESVGKLFLTRAVHAEYDGHIDLARNLAKQAKVYLEFLVKGKPSGTIRDRARCLELEGNFDGALNLLAEEKRPSVFSRHAAARVKLRMGAVEDARRSAVEILEFVEANGKMREYISTFLGFAGDVEAAAGNLPEAEKYWRRAIESNKSRRFTMELEHRLAQMTVESRAAELESVSRQGH